MNRRSFLGLLAGSAAAVAAAPIFARLAPAVEADQAAQLMRTLQDAPFLRRYPCPIGGRVVRAGGVERFSVVVQRLFRPERLIVSGAPAGMHILNVSSSGEPQMDETLDAGFFSERAFGVRLPFQPVAAGDEIVMAVHNTNSDPALFSAMLIGTCPITAEEHAEEERREREARLADAAEYDDDDDDDGDTDPDRVFES